MNSPPSEKPSGWQIKEAIAHHAATLALTEDPEEQELVMLRLAECIDAATDKLGAYGFVINRLKNEAELQGSREQEAQKARKALESKTERLKAIATELALAAETRTGHDRFKSIDGVTTIIRRRRFKRLVLAENAALPREYMRVTVEPDRPAFKALVEKEGPLVDAITGEVLAQLVDSETAWLEWK